MSSYSKNYNLIKPGETDNYNIEEVTNINADIIDAELFKKQEKKPGKDLSTNDFTNEYKKKLDELKNYDDSDIKEKISDLYNKNNSQEIEIDNLKTENELLKNQIPNGFEIGESIQLIDSSNLESVLKIKGNHKQENREGYNLLNVNLEHKTGYTRTINGITETYLEDGKIQYNGTSTSLIDFNLFRLLGFNRISFKS